MIKILGAMLLFTLMNNYQAKAASWNDLKEGSKFQVNADFVAIQLNSVNANDRAWKVLDVAGMIGFTQDHSERPRVIVKKDTKVTLLKKSKYIKGGILAAVLGVRSITPSGMSAVQSLMMATPGDYGLINALNEDYWLLLEIDNGKDKQHVLVNRVSESANANNYALFPALGPALPDSKTLTMSAYDPSAPRKAPAAR
jgi:hypothetical protein